jgi:hypothetical protein
MLAIGSLLISNSISAQKNTWTIGLYFGVQGQITSAVERDYYLILPEGTYFNDWQSHPPRTILSVFSHLPMQLSVQYNITDNISISTGIGYISYSTQWRDKSKSKWHVMDNFASNHYSSRESVQVPLEVHYKIPIKNTGFSVIPKFGLILDFSFAPHVHIEENVDSFYLVDYYAGKYQSVFNSIYSKPANNRTFDLIVNAGISFAYQFKSGFGLCLSGEYNRGTMRAEQLRYELQLKNPETGIVEYGFDYVVSNRNEYWNVLLGFTYTFKQKNKQ